MTQEEERLRLVVEAAVMKGLAVAIAHERERCAKICEEYASALDFSHSCDEFTAEALRDCATDIRKGEG